MIAAVSVCVGLCAGSAQAATVAQIRPSFSPDRLATSTAFTLAVTFSGGQEGVPSPVRKSVVHLPAGLGIDMRGVSTCSKARLRSHGQAGCPSSSRLGRGRALLGVRLGALTVYEEASIWAFRGPNQSGHAVVEFLGQGYTPLEERVVFGGVLGGDRGRYGSKLTISVPPIPSLDEEPDASTFDLSLTVGTARGRAHTAGAITVPRSCPAGGFPFAADFTFADGSTTSATARVRCP